MGKIQIAGIVAAAVIFLGMAGSIVWLKRGNDDLNTKLGAAEQREATALAAAAENKAALDTFKGQHEGAEKVAGAVSRALEEQRIDFERQNRRTFSAPLNQNNVVPGTLADTYDWVQQRRANAGAATGTGGPAGAANRPDTGLPGGASNGASQPAPAQRRSAPRRRADGANRGRRSVPHRGRRLEGVGRLHAPAGEECRGGLPGARRDPAAVGAGGPSGKTTAELSAP